MTNPNQHDMTLTIIPWWSRSMRRTGVSARGPATDPVTEWGVVEAPVMARVLVGV